MLRTAANFISSTSRVPAHGTRLTSVSLSFWKLSYCCCCCSARVPPLWNNLPQEVSQWSFSKSDNNDKAFLKGQHGGAVVSNAASRERDSSSLNFQSRWDRLQLQHHPRPWKGIHGRKWMEATSYRQLKILNVKLYQGPQLSATVCFLLKQWHHIPTWIETPFHHSHFRFWPCLPHPLLHHLSCLAASQRQLINTHGSASQLLLTLFFRKSS